MRYVAIDYGLKRLGLALCDPSETIVSPLCQLTLDRDRVDKTFEQIIRIINENQVDALVIGLPLNMDDSEGPQAKLTKQFAKQLAGKLSVPVYMQDERLSSHAADEKMLDIGLTRKKKKDRRDMLAACDILQDFLDQKKMND